MKKCLRCEVEKEESEFSWKIKATKKLQPWCKICHKKYKDSHYRENKPHLIKLAMVNNTRRREENKVKIRNFLLRHPCVDCGEKDPIVLHFDHKNKEDKSWNISRMVHFTYSWNIIEREMEKCEIRCANCHMRRTAQQFSWWGTKF